MVTLFHKQLKAYFALLAITFFIPSVFAQGLSTDINCSNNPARAWWDVTHYQLSVDFTDTINDIIYGTNIISAKVIKHPVQVLQIDLDSTLHIDNVICRGQNMYWMRKGNAYLLFLKNNQFNTFFLGDTFSIKINFSGRPIEAQNPPWDGGFIRTHDSIHHLWWAVACQGQGASLWFPCKNFQGDEPDSVLMTYTVPASLKAIGNGRLLSEKAINLGKSKQFAWKVRNPINNYDITFYIGDYVHWKDTFNGINGILNLNYYVLRGHKNEAKKQFKEVKPMLTCFETHFGPYPFYKDGYKLVEAPYLGMEHQSAVAYGNQFKMGYLGKDRSRSGIGLLFDFIIIHESAHEWFGNSITTFDKADSWVHEGFASYAETVFAECIVGKEMAFQYQRGKRRTIRNDKPVEGLFNHCDEGSADAYDKGGFLLHMIRLLMKNDLTFFEMIQEMDKKYAHQIVSGNEIEQFMATYSGLDLGPVFQQYLRTASLPVLCFTKDLKGQLWYQWKNCVPGFNMPIPFWLDGKQYWLHPTEIKQKLKNNILKIPNQISKDFLINIDWEQ